MIKIDILVGDANGRAARRSSRLAATRGQPGDREGSCMPDPVYRRLRQQVVPQLPRGVQARDALQLIAHAAICGGAQGAPLDFLTAGGGAA
jgi:hypothetical protein